LYDPAVNDYERIARVIRHLDQRATSQPTLDDLASLVGLRPSHFHRLFRRWAGVTPKDFLQCLTAQFARQRLRDSASVLDVSLRAGLSGPGRLHDLLVTLDAVSPGELKRRGADVQIRWGFAQTPFGVCSIAWNVRGICHLGFPDTTAGDDPPAELLNDWCAAERTRDDRGAERHAGMIFSRSPGNVTELRALVRGSPFQLKVWRALLRIPPGSLATYGRIARAIGTPDAARAVGTACGQNPIAILIPCHRVIRQTGIVDGYRWDTPRKRALLAWESNGRTMPRVVEESCRAPAAMVD
jgi:AraC family transcriptional regulator, regulatory protein of adaptative response / methylated-DNA-[protein]-cysteine methyltransferase